MQLREDRHHTGYTIVASTQPQDKLEDRRSQNNKMSTNLWKKDSSKGRNREKEKTREKNQSNKKTGQK